MVSFGRIPRSSASAVSGLSTSEAACLTDQEAILASYKMYFLSEDAISSSETISFEHDLAAVEFARSKPCNQAVQIWQAERFIGEVRHRKDRTQPNCRR